MKALVLESLQVALKKLGYETEDVSVDPPRDSSHGDFATPIALVLAKKTGTSPQEIAQQIIDTIDASHFENISLAGPGFINIRLKQSLWADYLTDFDPGTLSATKLLKGKHILLEHSSLNLFKPFSIGHLVNNSLGVSLRNIMSYAGADVTEVSFPSDVSPGVAKGVWAIMDSGWEDDLDITKIGEAYRLGVIAYKEDASAKQEIDRINKEIYEQVEGDALDVYKKTRVISMEYFDAVLQALGTHHDQHLFESRTAPIGTELVRKHTPEIFTESDGAIIFEGSKHGLFDNVFVNSAGFATYLAKDLGLIQLKLDEYPDIDKYITVADIEQKQHFQLVKKAAEFVFPQDVNRIEYVQHGRLSLPTGRISSRDGGVPIAEDLIETLVEETKGTAEEAGKSMDDGSAHQVAMAALRYSLLRASAEKSVVFDIDSSLSFEGDSGPYIQYTYVRARSILKKIDDLESVLKQDIVMHDGLIPLVRLLEQFSGKVERSLQDHSAHHIAQHLLEIAQAFNSFYGNTKIADPEHESYAAHVMMTYKVSEVLSAGLWLLGIKTVEEM